jgi:hypothetical protein
VGRGAEREKQAAKGVVFEESGDVNTYTRRTTAKERLATAAFAANCAEWRVSGPRGTGCTAFQGDGSTPDFVPPWRGRKK